jgi:hypothetical protein
MGQEWESSKRGARKFAREVDPNKYYYTVHTAVYPWGDELVCDRWQFNEKALWPFTGWRSGAVSAEGACLRFGPMLDEMPRHARPLWKHDEPQYTPADLLKARRERASR